MRSGQPRLFSSCFARSDDHLIVLVQGLRRFGLRKITSTDPFIRAEVTLLNSAKPGREQGVAGTFPKPARLGRSVA